MRLNPVSDASAHFDRLDALARIEREERESNRLYARESFDAALKTGSPVWTPRLNNLKATSTLGEVINDYADPGALATLVLAAEAGADVKLLAGLILSNVREAHASHCADAGL